MTSVRHASRLLLDSWPFSELRIRSSSKTRLRVLCWLVALCCAFLGGPTGFVGEALAAAPAGGGLPLSGVTLRAPILRPGKIIGIGQNYLDHAKESQDGLGFACGSVITSTTSAALACFSRTAVASRSMVLPSPVNTGLSRTATR